MEASEFIRNAGYPSVKEVLNPVKDGNLVGIPYSADDIRRYFEITQETRNCLSGRKSPIRGFPECRSRIWRLSRLGIPQIGDAEDHGLGLETELTY
jgi:hypothetical protein